MKVIKILCVGKWVVRQSDASAHYSIVRLYPSLADGWDIQITFADNSFSIVSHIALGTNLSKYEFERNERGNLSFRAQLNDSLIGYVDLNSKGELFGDVYVWNKITQDYAYYFPFEYSISDIEQIFIKDGNDWIEFVFSLADGEVQAIAWHDSIPYNIKKILILDSDVTSSGIQLEFSRSGNTFSTVEIHSSLIENQGIKTIRNSASDFLELIGRAHLKVSNEFDITSILLMNPIEVLRLSDY